MKTNLYENYQVFEEIINNHDGSEYIDTSNHDFLAPTALIPLLCESKKRGIKRITTHYDTYDHIYRILNRLPMETTTPFTILPSNKEQKAENEVAMSMANKINHDYGGHQVLYHIINELTDNVYNHTSFEKGYANQGYAYAQEYPLGNALDICVMDDGLSIPGRFKKSDIKYDDECHAIQMAVSKTSTAKDNENDRGNGLWTTLKLVIEANGGEALIVSGKGSLHIKNTNNYKYRLLENYNMFKGTLITLRLNKNRVQNFYEWIDVFDIHDYKYK
jgi:hypothetical protein